MTLTEVRQLIAAIDLRPSKALGQNFLVDNNILQIILREAHVRADETVIEIGPGLGCLTEELMIRAKRVIAIEKDPRLCAYLRDRFPNLELIAGDAVKILGSQFAIPSARTKVVSNLPYSISSPILECFVEGDPKPGVMVVTLQREVAQRLGATPGHKEYGALTLFTQLYYHVTIAHIISPSCFYPAPQVESAVVVLERRDPRVKLEDPKLFHDLVRHGFNQRRKMLRKLLAEFGTTEAAYHAAGVEPTARAEELSLDQWITLTNAIPRRADGDQLR